MTFFKSLNYWHLLSHIIKKSYTLTSSKAQSTDSLFSQQYFKLLDSNQSYLSGNMSSTQPIIAALNTSAFMKFPCDLTRKSIYTAWTPWSVNTLCTKALTGSLFQQQSSLHSTLTSLNSRILFKFFLLIFSLRKLLFCNLFNISC